MPYQKLSVHISLVNDPYFNLALEDYLFRQLPPHEHLLYLWRNEPAVVIGRSQNPWVECRVAQMEADGVHLVRRQSGGGAVYQDLGNAIFTFMSANSHYDKSANMAIVQNALRHYGIEAEPRGRNDLVVAAEQGYRKISGSAFRQTQTSSFHHGTLLVNVDFDRLQAYLQPDPKKLEAKGVKSVRSRVINLSELAPHMTHNGVSQALWQAFEQYYGVASTVQYWDWSALTACQALNDQYQLLTSWEWRFGRTLAFTHQLQNRFDWGSIDVRCEVNRGVIEKAQVFSDTLHPELTDWLQQQLCSVYYSSSSVQHALAQGRDQLPYLQQELTQLQQWLAREIEGD